MKKASDKRQFSSEGFMLADAIITRVGKLPYTRAELGMSGSGTIMLDRPRDVIEKALDTMVGAPVTKGHPSKFVSSNDWKRDMVGSIVTKPVIDEKGNVKASVRIYDKEAIDNIQRGEHQLSPGFNFVPEFLNDDSGVIREMSFNHLAVLPNGRAGESVRILDQLPPALHHMETTIMDEDKQKEVIRQAVSDAMKDFIKADGSKDNQNKVVDALNEKLTKATDELASIKSKQAKDEADTKTKEAEDSVKKQIEDARKEERARYAIIEDAKQFIDEEKHAELIDMEARDIMTLAVGDKIEGADQLSLETLNGVMMAMKKLAKDQGDSTRSVPLVKTEATDGDKKDLHDIYDQKFKKVRGLEVTKEK